MRTLLRLAFGSRLVSFFPIVEYDSKSARRMRESMARGLSMTVRAGLKACLTLLSRGRAEMAIMGAPAAAASDPDLAV